MRPKPLPALVALLAAVIGLTLATHYPLAPTVGVACVLVFWIAIYVRPDLWLLVLPALLPVIGFAPWSGWITFEELDFLILAVATGGYARLAWPARSNPTAEQTRFAPTPRLSLAIGLLAGLFALDTGVSVYRGFLDAGGFSFGWYQGYHEPMNSVRVGKSFFLALLLVPLWQVACKKDATRALAQLSLGLMLGLATAAFTTIWERAAFTDLLNFSADYRTTGMFWEMHVGGAALDGFLALTVPFAVREVMVARSKLRWGLAAGVLTLAAYACLTTFSRGVYLAVPAGMIALLVLTGRSGLARSAHHHDATALWDPNPWRSVLAGLVLAAGFAFGAYWMFPTSGYRGMAALWGVTALMLPLVQVLHGFRARQWLVGWVTGLLLILVAAALSWLTPKGAYAAWGLSAALTTVMLGLGRRPNNPYRFAGLVAFAGFVATVASTVLIAGHWGQAAGLRHAAPVLLVLLAVCAAAGMWREPLWPTTLRWQASTAGAMGLVAAVVAVMGGGAYMSERFSTSGQDFGGRLGHWQLGRDMLRTPADGWLGKGLGRFPFNYFLNGNPQQHPGDYRLGQDGDDAYITLAGGLHETGWGEMFRVTQRVSPPVGAALVTARVRSAKDAKLHLEVCEKHLLYNQRCLIAQVKLKGATDVWQDLRVPLKGQRVSRGAWYAPKLLAFSMAMATPGGVVQIDNVSLTGADGRQLLVNGGFSDGMAHWFFSSDRHHLPWHIKNMVMNVLFDQGAVGASLWSLLLATALWHTSLGKARQHPLAPVLAASLTGFWVVGLFDSLLDAPRVAWLFYLLMLMALTLPPASPSPRVTRNNAPGRQPSKSLQPLQPLHPR